MPAGATPLLPVTKVGAGDKERAYVLRQNCVLKFLLGCVCCFSLLSTVLVYTRYEVSVQRRASIAGAKNHREEEHASHMRVMRLSMLLQRHLEDEVHDVAVLTTYRAWLMRAVGDYQLKVLERAANCTAGVQVRDGLRADGAAFDAEIEKLLKLLWDDVVQEGKVAQKQLHNITHAIVAELRQDASEQGAYERVMHAVDAHKATLTAVPNQMWEGGVSWVTGLDLAPVDGAGNPSVESVVQCCDLDSQARFAEYPQCTCCLLYTSPSPRD